MSEFDKTKDTLAEIISKLDRIESNTPSEGFIFLARHVPKPADVQDQMLRLGYISASQAIADAIRFLAGSKDKEGRRE